MIGALLVKKRRYRPKLLLMVLVLGKLRKVSTFTIPHYVAIFSKLNLLVMSKVQCPIQESGYKSTRKVFSGEHEKLIADFLVTAGDMYFTHGLSPNEVRQLAYQCAKQFTVNFPPRPNWAVNSAAGEDWLPKFISRNNVLSIQRPV